MIGQFIYLLLLIGFPLPNAHGFTLNNNVEAAFEEDELVVNVADHSCDNIGIDRQEVLQIATTAMEQYWNTVPTSRIRLKKGKLKNVSSDFKTGDICQGSASSSCTPNTALEVASNILITCNNSSNNFSSTGVLALAVPNNIDGDKIKGAIVALNDMAGTEFANLSRSEMTSVIAHEVGHGLGLGHSPVEDALMHFQSSSFRQKLGWDDIDGITYLYPKEQPVSCGTWKDLASKNSGPPIIALLLGLSFLTLLLRKSSRFVGKYLPSA